ncbi:DNA-binding response regulator [Chryseomicrobium excrementi]|uniref:DNA-binding response regulator n=1 Tax=Chryseomicrobium excrementi TaxID=2041346 RepID=A0A2M9EYZ6_9BACL|nr:response regulator transcription factor [Chryseomicrobium excrementi]PJK16442.1 DNA-binding response regulator [Chryseomicrobium excrementi]
MIRIVLAEDQRMLLGALGSLLELEEDMEVVGLARDGEEALQLVEDLSPDICITDIEMPNLTGLELAEKLKDHPCKVLILTTFARSGYFEKARQAEVDGYLIKDSPSEELAYAIRSILGGRKMYSPELMELAFDAPNPLTERELQIMELMAEGKSSKEISSVLFLSSGTVRNYISVILDKLQVSNRIEAISKAKEKGWYK